MRGEYLAAGLSLMLLERLAVERLPFVGGLPVVVEAVLVERGEHVAVRVEGDSVVFGVCLERVLVSEGEPFARLTDEAPALGAVESAAEPHLGAVEAAAFREELPAGLGHVFGHVVVFAPSTSSRSSFRSVITAPRKCMASAPSDCGIAPFENRFSLWPAGRAKR